ncbi:MFS transporter [Conexibacter woesei]|uniref:MFS transporter n=1 Tax=Conexibacter woesei TaxID=191495 RepID=UPI00047C21B0|nr:MFS transporter [Conexibacter woesei]
MSRAYLMVLSAAALCYMALGAVLRILPQHVQHDLGGSAAALGFAVGAPALTAIATRPLAGRAADRIGPRPLVVGGALVMSLGVLPAFSGGVFALDASRLIVGAGEGAMMAATALWLLRLSGPEHRGRALGHIGLANYTGLALGPLLASALGTSDHAVFLAALVLPLLGAAATLPVPAAPPAEPADARPAGAAPRGPSILRATLRPGIGLMLVNIGYVAVIAFGADAGHSAVVVPLFAVVVVGVRLAGAGLPDRFGATNALRACVLAEGIGLIVLAVSGSAPVALAATALLAAGQALAVPALGVLALKRVDPTRHGAAAGLFFSWFDAGVGLGGPAVGLAARAVSPAAAIALSGAAVLSVWPVVVPPRVAATARRLSATT